MTIAPKYLVDSGQLLALTDGDAPGALDAILRIVGRELESEYGRHTLLELAEDQSVGLAPRREMLLDNDGDVWVWTCQHVEYRYTNETIPKVVFHVMPQGIDDDHRTRAYASEADAWTALLVALNRL